VLLAGEGNAVKRADRTADAAEPKIQEGPDGRRIASHDVFNRIILGDVHESILHV
jgi:hypothetical protein